MSKLGENEAKLEAEQRDSPDHVTSSGNVFTSFIKKVPYTQISPALKRRVKNGVEPVDPNKRSAVSQIFHSAVPDAVKKKFSRGAGYSPDIAFRESDEEDAIQRLRRTDVFEVAPIDITLREPSPLLNEIHPAPMSSAHDPDSFQVESDDENTDHDGLISSLFNQLTSIPAIDNEIKKIKSEIEVTQRNNTELTKKYLETVTGDSQLPDLQSRETYNQRNLKSQKHVRGLQKKLKDLEDRRKRMREQEALNNGGEELELAERQRTPDHVKRTGVIQGVYKKAVAKRRKARPLDEKHWGSDGALDSSGVLEIADSLQDSMSTPSHRGDHVPSIEQTEVGPAALPVVPNMDYPELLSDEEENHIVAQEDLDNLSDRADSVSNLSEPVGESITKLKDDYQKLLKEMDELRAAHREVLLILEGNLEKQHDLFFDALKDTQHKIRQIDEKVDDKLDNFSYSSEERVKEIEEKLDDYRFKMTRFEKIQEQERSEGPLAVSDLPSRLRDVMSSVISLGLAMVSFVLFIFTTALDFVKVFSENNILSTGLSLGLFAVVVALYYYFFDGSSSPVITGKT